MCEILRDRINRILQDQPRKVRKANTSLHKRKQRELRLLRQDKRDSAGLAAKERKNLKIEPRNMRRARNTARISYEVGFSFFG
jgi:hypothetical protein